jgi:hypothetical protein
MKQCQELISIVSFFKIADHSFLTQLVICLKLNYFLPEDSIIEEGTPGDRMYFIESGTVELIRNGKVITLLQGGSYFGETSCLHNGMKRIATIRAVEECVLHSIEKNDLLRILEFNYAMAEELRTSAQRWLQEVNMSPRTTLPYHSSEPINQSASIPGSVQSLPSLPHNPAPTNNDDTSSLNSLPSNSAANSASLISQFDQVRRGSVDDFEEAAMVTASRHPSNRKKRSQKKPDWLKVSQPLEAIKDEPSMNMKQEKSHISAPGLISLNIRTSNSIRDSKSPVEVTIQIPPNTTLKNNDGHELSEHDPTRHQANRELSQIMFAEPMKRRKTIVEESLEEDLRLAELKKDRQKMPITKRMRRQTEKHSPSLLYAPFFPDSLFIKMWRSFMEVVFFLIIILLPLALSTLTFYDTLKPISIISCVMITIDIVLRLQTGLEIGQDIVMEPTKILLISLRNGSLLISLVCGFPWALITDGFTTQGSNTQKFARLICITHGIPFVQLVLSKSSSWISDQSTTFIRKYDITVSAIQAFKILAIMVIYW